MKQFKETLIEEVGVSDLDLEYPFYDKDGEGEPNDVETAEDVWSETVSMDINKAISILEDLKKKGSQMVYIYAHSDHNAYIFTGVKVEEITEG